MRSLKFLFVMTAFFFIYATAAAAGDFDWLKELNIEAKADGSGFNTTLKTRFKLGDVEVNAVLSNADSPADAYMVLKMGELSNQPLSYVLKQYKKSRGKGWGVMAKGLGIKPASKEFKALKAGHDLKGGEHKDKGHGKKDKQGKGKGRGKN